MRRFHCLTQIAVLILGLTAGHLAHATDYSYPEVQWDHGLAGVNHKGFCSAGASTGGYSHTITDGAFAQFHFRSDIMILGHRHPFFEVRSYADLSVHDDREFGGDEWTGRSVSTTARIEGGEAIVPANGHFIFHAPRTFWMGVNLQIPSGDNRTRIGWTLNLFRRFLRFAQGVRVTGYIIGEVRPACGTSSVTLSGRAGVLGSLSLTGTLLGASIELTEHNNAVAWIDMTAHTGEAGGRATGDVLVCAQRSRSVYSNDTTTGTQGRLVAGPWILERTRLYAWYYR